MKSNSVVKKCLVPSSFFLQLKFLLYCLSTSTLSPSRPSLAMRDITTNEKEKEWKQKDTEERITSK